MYSSIVTRNLLPMRKKILIFLNLFFWIVIILLITFGVLLSIKLRMNARYAYILCTDPLLLCLKIGPFLASINFSIIIFLIKKRVQEGSTYFQIDEARKISRLRTINRLQIITILFNFVNLFLIFWDVTRLV
jgi:hypothetical protein